MIRLSRTVAQSLGWPSRPTKGLMMLDCPSLPNVLGICLTRYTRFQPLFSLISHRFSKIVVIYFQVCSEHGYSRKYRKNLGKTMVFKKPPFFKKCPKRTQNGSKISPKSVQDHPKPGSCMIPDRLLKDFCDVFNNLLSDFFHFVQHCSERGAVLEQLCAFYTRSSDTTASGRPTESQ